MTKLSDSQRVILSTAAQHEMGLARAPKALPAAARNAVFRSLIKNNLLTEINAPREHVGLGWRQDEDGTWIGARITDDGLRAIGIEPNEGDATESEPDCSGIEGSVPDTARTVAPAAEAATQDATVAEADQAAPLTKEIAMLDQALAARAASRAQLFGVARRSNAHATAPPLPRRQSRLRAAAGPAKPAGSALPGPCRGAADAGPDRRAKSEHARNRSADHADFSGGMRG